MSHEIDPRTGAAPRRDPLARLEGRAARSPVRVLGRNPALVVARVARRFVDVRVTGLAAEMTFYLALSLFPLLAAFGSSLGLLQRVIGTDAVLAIEDQVVENLQLVLSQELTADVVAPMVRDLLRTERVGVAVTGLAVALWLGSRVFRAAIRSLDDAYQVEERRTLVQQYLLSLLFTLGAVVVATVLVTTVVVGPLLGWGRQAADVFGAGSAYEWTWAYGRWLVLFAVAVAWLSWLYHAGPNVANTWRETLPGAVAAVVGLLLISTGFRVYVEVAGPQGPDLESGSAAVLAVTQAAGTALAALLYGWLGSMAVLLGGLVNAELAQPLARDPGPTRPAPAPARQGERSR